MTRFLSVPLFGFALLVGHFAYLIISDDNGPPLVRIGTALALGSLALMLILVAGACLFRGKL